MRRNIRGFTAEQSAPIHDWVEFINEALDARDAILEWRKGSGPVPVPWPNWVKAMLPPGTGPDLCRWQWEDISRKGNALGNACWRSVYLFGDPYDEANPHRELASWFTALLMGHFKAYRLVRYAWFTNDREWEDRMESWAKRTRAQLGALPLDDTPAV